ncbi:hypothetical protein [Klebsiella pneumoniae]|uniref:hypothetical protein n=1 Tax=Klebsiella pneumoniae TaxID=573 RepID=UPI0039E01B07
MDQRQTKAGIVSKHQFWFALFLSNVAFAVDNKEEIAPVRIGCPTPAMPVKAQALRTEGSVDYAAWVNDKGEVYESTKRAMRFSSGKLRLRLKCKFVPGHPGILYNKIQSGKTLKSAFNV